MKAPKPPAGRAKAKAPGQPYTAKAKTTPLSRKMTPKGAK